MSRTAQVAILLSVGALIGFSSFTETLDLKILDSQFRMLRDALPESVAKDVVIVGIVKSTIGWRD